jgi:hypothetical protein
MRRLGPWRLLNWFLIAIALLAILYYWSVGGFERDPGGATNTPPSSSITPQPSTADISSSQTAGA